MVIGTRLYAACMMQVAAGGSYAPHTIRVLAVPNRPQPRAGRGVVEHPHPARRLPGADALRPVPEEPRHRAEHPGAPAECAGRGRVARAPRLL